MITFALEPGAEGDTIATTGDHTVSGYDPCRVIARALVEAGCVDQSWEMTRAGKQVMYGPSVHWLAASTLTENDAGFQRGWWRRHPRGASRPILEAVVATQKVLAKARRAVSALSLKHAPRAPASKLHTASVGVPVG